MDCVFDPAAIKATLKRVLPDKQRKAALSEWDKTVAQKIKTWSNNRENQAGSQAQLTFAANVVAYVNFLWDMTKVPPNSKEGTSPRDLAKEIPLYGPRFVPPTYMYLRKRDYLAEIKPQTAYLKVLTIIHPVYYPEIFKCPRCGSTERPGVRWDGWNSPGPREVCGMRRSEMALGYQIRCNLCSGELDERGNTTHCFATTNPLFWQNWETYLIPRGIPIFFKRCSITRDLFDLIVELRLTMTSAGLAENIRQLHLQEYHQTVREYLTYFRSRKDTPILRPPLRDFSAPDDADCYEDTPITCDKITDIILEYSEKTRREESSEFIRTLTGIVVSIDNTFKVGDKATVSKGRGRSRLNVMKGGLLNMISERNHYLGWNLCLTGASKNISNLLRGYKRRCQVQGASRNEPAVPLPEMLSADNCCNIRTAVEEIFGPGTHIVLDVYHCMMRYLVTLHNGKKNPHRKQVAHAIVDAILKERSVRGGKPARYWGQDEQEIKMQEMFEHWSRIGGVWTATSTKVHADQLAHVKKGCLTRTRDDIASDGSRIEGRHKGWNSLMRANASGLIVFVALGHDHVHRCNIRIEFSSSSPSPFVQSTYGSHHTRLVNDNALLWNVIRKSPTVSNRQALQPRPSLPHVDSGETFGLVQSDLPQVDDELLELKPEDSEDPDAIENEPDLLEVALDTLANPGELHSYDLPEPHLSTPAPKPQGEVIDLTNEEKTSAGTQPLSPPESSAPAAGILPAPRNARNTKRKHSAPAQDEEDGAIEGRAQKSQKRSAATTGGARTDGASISTASTKGAAQPPTRVPAAALRVSAPTAQAVVSTTTVAPIFQPHAHATPTHEQHASATVSTHGPAIALRTASTPAAADSNLSAPLPLPPVPSDSLLHGLSRSARFLKQCTGIDINALTISSDDEFWLFADMRLELQWVTSAMTPRRWIDAMEEYNRRLQAKHKGPPEAFVPKSARALHEKLKDLEAEIVRRISANDFISFATGTETFWKKQCEGVRVTKEEPGADYKLTLAGRKRLPQICSRCALEKYPFPKRSPENHRATHCSDGVRVRAPKEFPESLPRFPQPTGIFSGGSHMHVDTFLRMVRDVYMKAVVLDQSQAFTLEEAAFTDLVAERMEELSEGLGFKLLKHLTLTPPREDLVVTRGDDKFLLIRCMRTVTAATVAAAVPAATTKTSSGGQGPSDVATDTPDATAAPSSSPEKSAMGAEWTWPAYGTTALSTEQHAATGAATSTSSEQGTTGAASTSSEHNKTLAAGAAGSWTASTSTAHGATATTVSTLNAYGGAGTASSLATHGTTATVASTSVSTSRGA